MTRAVWRSPSPAAGHGVLGRPTAKAGMTTGKTASHLQERRTVFDTVRDGLLLYGLNGRLLYANAAARILLGTGNKVATDAMTRVEERLADFTHYARDGQPLRRAERPLWRALRAQHAGTYEAADAIGRGPHGGEQVLNVSAAPVFAGARLAGAVLILRDRTEVRRLEHELAERASEIEALLESTGDGLVVYDAQERITRMNLAARLLMGGDTPGMSRGSSAETGLQHLPLLDSKHQLLPRAEWPVMRILGGETLSSERAVDVCIQRPDGAEAVLGMSGAPVRDTRGRIVEDRLTDSESVHWTISPQPIDGVVRIDGKPYRFMGRGEGRG
ncbi:MAG TPA: PAS domain-containing protein, partial [Ktedonobacterales bacterium]|nr:PAS domain-containing protein [Ktedonobacterales bacterium]